MFRADASPAIGGGHVMRCMALAKALAARGARITFVTDRETVATVPSLLDSGYTIIDAGSHATLAEVLMSSGVASGAVLVVDHYGVGTQEVSACRAILDQVVVVDDLAAGPHDCDLLLNQNVLGDDNPYLALIPIHAKVLLGPQFAMLRPAFAALRPAALARRSSAQLKRIFISFGLTDVGGWALKCATVLAESDFKIDIAVGGSAPTIPALRDLASRHENVTLHVDARDLPEIMAAADLAIGAGGSNSWERCCLGLPSLIGVVAENQRTIALALEAASAARLFMEQDIPDLTEIAHAIGSRPDALKSMEEKASAICDGHGAERVAEAILSLPDAITAGAMSLRPANAGDRVDFWLIRNDPTTRGISGQKAAIPWEDHATWWSSATTSKQRLLLVVEVGGHIAGYVRFDHVSSGDAVISIALAQQFRGAGVGSRALQAGLSALAELKPQSGVVAHVRKNNLVSINMFKRCGFCEVGSEGEFLVFRAPRDRDQSRNPGADAWK